MTSGTSATQASTQRCGMALSRWCSAGKPLVLTFPANGEGTVCGRGVCLGHSAGAAELVRHPAALVVQTWRPRFAQKRF